MKVNYHSVRWAAGYHARCKPEDALAVLKSIQDSTGDGDITPSQVVAAASDPDSPIHPVFTWDDGEAAKAYREEEARRLVRSLIVQYSQRGKNAIESRVYEVVRAVPASKDSPGKKVYRAMEDLLADPQARGELITRAMNEHLTWRRRYQQLQELAVIFEAADRVIERVGL